jgi:hypothetical protein
MDFGGIKATHWRRSFEDSMYSLPFGTISVPCPSRETVPEIYGNPRKDTIFYLESSVWQVMTATTLKVNHSRE